MQAPGRGALGMEAKRGMRDVTREGIKQTYRAGDGVSMTTPFFTRPPIIFCSAIKDPN
jgi:hypothetical protein